MTNKLNGKTGLIVSIVSLAVIFSGVFMTMGRAKEKILNNVDNISENKLNIKELDEKFQTVILKMAEDVAGIKGALGVK